ncbi:asparagine synthase-related protein [Kineococcus sp. SYSU DK001]|uniref:asparagine synthase-related protein n=1 Tax=Kineococcus sp. SYSU DK001 TaxID=3383122 RepID=UPI003D7C6EAB
MINGGSFVVLLPDTPAAAPVAAQLTPACDLQVAHASGRPWLLARRGPSPAVVHAGEQPCRLVVLGCSDVSAQDLTRSAQRVRTAPDVTTLAQRWAGSHLVLASLQGQVHASGPAMETRRLFHAVLGGVHVLADRADVLAELGGFGVDAAVLADRLVRCLPHPLRDAPLWREVSAVPGGVQVTLERDGRAVSSRRWWQPPAAELSRRQGAVLLRDGLAAAVAARTAGGRAITCDLSGGLDSTPVCYFASRGPSGVLARTLYNDDPGGREDLHWARIALRAMPGVHTHLTGSTDELPDFFGGLPSLRVQFDEPTQAVTAGPRISALLADDAGWGIRVHLNGLGGDHLLRGVRGWQHGLARRRPLLAWRRARAEDAPAGVSGLDTLRQLLDRRSYAQWLSAVTEDAVTGVAPPEVPSTSDWSTRPTLPPWLSQDARASVIDHLRTAAADAEPLDTDRAVHLDLSFLRDAGRLVRGTAQIGQPIGVAYESPLMDDRVAEAVLAVRREERDTPLEWKPLMKEAVRDLLPPEYLRRVNKVGGSPQAVRGYAAHHRTLLELCEDSGLVQAGVLDLDRFAAASAPDALASPTTHVHATVNAALFLRNLRTGSATAGDVDRSRSDTTAAVAG